MPTKNPKVPLALIAVFGMAALAGCTNADTDATSSAATPVLDVDKERAWTGEDITFDAQASEARGTIKEYRFDFGDGQQMTVTDDDAARVKHAYTKGGVYEAVLTLVVEEEDGEID